MGLLNEILTMPRHITAIYPGTFDPMTLGHLDMVARASLMFDKVIVAVAAAHHKKTMFTMQERMEMVSELVKPYPQVSVEHFSGLVIDFATTHGATVMLRGLRSGTDFDYEYQLAGMNHSLKPEVETVFLTPGVKYLFISSTLVREISTLGGDVEQFVHPVVARSLRAKLRSLGEV
jgi:pantetheine-phosphate adenylyltransferase